MDIGTRKAAKRDWKLVSSLAIVALALSDAGAHAADYGQIAAYLEDSAKVAVLKSQLSGTWQIVVTDPSWTFQASVVGRALVSIGDRCGLQMKMGSALQRVDHYVWPIILPDPSSASILQALASLSSSIGEAVPPVAEDGAATVYAHLARWGIGEARVHSPTGQQFNFVFMDGHQLNSGNDLAAYEYAVASTVAGFALNDDTPIADEDFSYALSGGGPLAALAGTNDDRWGRLCRVMNLEPAVCGGNVSSDDAKVRALLATDDSLCAADGAEVKELRDTEENARNVLQKSIG